MKLFKNLFFLFFLITASSVYAQNCDFEISSSPHPADPMIMGFGHVGPDEPLNALWEFGDDSTANWTKGGQHTYEK